MNRTRSKRPWIAALLAFVYPGLGHVYLRSWARALLWFGLTVATTVLVTPDAALGGAEPTLESVRALASELSPEALVALFGVTLLSMTDAYWIATEQRRRETVVEGEVCPACGREIDEDLAFCHWCTTRLDDPDAQSDDSSVESDDSDAGLGGRNE